MQIFTPSSTKHTDKLAILAHWTDRNDIAIGTSGRSPGESDKSLRQSSLSVIFSLPPFHKSTSLKYDEYQPILRLNPENQRDPTFWWKSTSRSRIFQTRDLDLILYSGNAHASILMFRGGRVPPLRTRTYAFALKTHISPKHTKMYKSHPICI